MIDKMLMKDPNHRYADCGDIIRDLGGLGLPIRALSFIESAGAKRPRERRGRRRFVAQRRRGCKPTAVPVGQSALMPPSCRPSGSGSSSAEDAARSAPRRRLRARRGSCNTRGPTAKVVISKMSTPRNHGRHQERVDRSGGQGQGLPSGSFMPLAQYAEFASLASNRAAKMQADSRSRKTQDMYNKLDRQEQRRDAGAGPEISAAASRTSSFS